MVAKNTPSMTNKQVLVLKITVYGSYVVTSLSVHTETRLSRQENHCVSKTLTCYRTFFLATIVC